MGQATAVIFGAGSVGRGFLGQLFSESGYEIVFVDVDDVLVEALAAEGRYTLRLAGVDETRELVIEPVRVVDGRDADAVAAEVAQAALVATAVGARALPIIARPIASGLERRWRAREDAAPLNIVICENLHDAPDLLRGYLSDALPDELQDHLADRVGLVPAVIARMSPVPTEEQRAADPTLIVAEPYKVLPVDREAFVGAIPDVVGMKPVAPFEAYTERKLYIHNAAHAMLGYLGYRRGLDYGYEALVDPVVRPIVDEALAESVRALVSEHGFETQELREHVDDLLARFANRALGDPIDRLARDPLRKLSPNDRLVGAARLAQSHGIEPKGLSWGIAGALAYDNPADDHAVHLQERIAEEGLVAVLEAVCEIGAQEALAEEVLERYVELRSDPLWGEETG